MSTATTTVLFRGQRFEVHGTAHRPGPDRDGLNAPFFVFDLSLEGYRVRPVHTYCTICVYPTAEEANIEATQLEASANSR